MGVYSKSVRTVFFCPLLPCHYKYLYKLVIYEDFMQKATLEVVQNRRVENGTKYLVQSTD